MASSFRDQVDEVDAQVLYEKVLKEATLWSHGLAELLEAVQHHPESPYLQQHDHPLEDHIAAARRDMDDGTVILDDLMRSELTARQRSEIEKYAAQRRDDLEARVMPACQALLAGDYRRANAILLREVRPARLPVFDNGISESGNAERTISVLTLLFGAIMALSFFIMATA